MMPAVNCGLRSGSNWQAQIWLKIGRLSYVSLFLDSELVNGKKDTFDNAKNQIVAFQCFLSNTALTSQTMKNSMLLAVLSLGLSQLPFSSVDMRS